MLVTGGLFGEGISGEVLSVLGLISRLLLGLLFLSPRLLLGLLVIGLGVLIFEYVLRNGRLDSLDGSEVESVGHREREAVGLILDLLELLDEVASLELRGDF